jgi:zinc transport system substrate-binding protein
MRTVRRTRIFVALAGALSLLAAWPGAGGGAAAGEEAAGTRVVVSVPPHQYFAERIGGDRVRVQVLIPPGRSPAVFTPAPKQMTEIARADIFFRAGVPFEAALVPRLRQSVPALPIVDLRQGVDLRPLADHHHHPGGHGDPAGDHHDAHGDGHHGEPGDEPRGAHDEEHHEEPGQGGGDDGGDGEAGRRGSAAGAAAAEPGDGTDPHVWLSPLKARQQARTLRDGLIRIDPAGEAGYRKRCAALIDDLETLHEELQETLAPVRGETLFVFHPAYGYFTEAYGLEQVAVETGGKAPRGAELAGFVRRAKEAGIRAVFVQPQFERRAAQTIAEAVGASVVTLDPLGADYLQNLRRIGEKVRRALAAREGEAPDG